MNQAVQPVNPPVKISVVIPVLNEARLIARTLEGLAVQVLPEDVGIEVLIADGGSTDGTMAAIETFFEINDSMPVRVFGSERGRAQQQNCGAAFAQGDVLLFLHADTVPAPNAVAELAKAIRRPETLFGYFPVKYQAAPPNVLADVYSAATEINSVLFHYGDSGIFARRSFFERIGRFTEMELLEDVEFLLRAQKESSPVLITNAFVTTSSRRFERHGFAATQLLNAAVVGLYLLGAPPKDLRSLYDLFK
ncbi:MAG: TIGR04283 family arsenosugar biosynthesis glycosyltransferase [Rhizobacter sp.]|nr:TIGR04283 family arsenosugar biosynthesis glycosyltransferase [Chlorobiales bacterium]